MRHGGRFFILTVQVSGMRVDVIGIEPPCKRCKEAYENVLKAADMLKMEGVDIEVQKLDAMSEETMDRFGLVFTPSIAVDGVVKILGKVPDPGVIVRLIRRERAALQ
ncbi:thioredoxin family protein [Candidatus Bathyarchaeota archaeon]|nr:thioredoxin family protein [Candidatus Bathyarchaeota archaeon]